MVSHGFHVDVMSVKANPEQWCDYCAITMLKIRSDGEVENVINACDGHVASKVKWH